MQITLVGEVIFGFMAQLIFKGYTSPNSHCGVVIRKVEQWQMGRFFKRGGIAKGQDDFYKTIGKNDYLLQGV